MFKKGNGPPYCFGEGLSFDRVNVLRNSYLEEGVYQSRVEG